MDTFASVWDAADDVAADQSLRSLTSARMQVAPVWSFLAAATSDQDFSNRLALHEDRLQAAADAHGVDFVALASSLVDDYRTLKAEAAKGDGVVKGGKDGCDHDFDFRNKCKKCGGQLSFPKESSFYVEDGGEKVGGPYDTKADAQDAINGGDVSGSNLKVEQDGDEDGETNDEDSDDSDSDDDAPTAKDDDGDSDDSDDDKGGNPFAKKESSLANLDSLFPVIAAHSVVHQPGETVFVDHFMGHDEHEGRKGVWAQVVASPGQHGHEDRAESHLLKPMAPGGTHFFHHFGGLQKKAYGDGPTRDYEPYFHGQGGFKQGLGSYPHPPNHDEEHATSAGGAPHRATWKPHRVYDSLNSAVNHLAGGPFQEEEERPGTLPGYGNLRHERVRDHASALDGYNHCNSCDHVYATTHPEHEVVGHKDVCPNCNDTDFHETAAEVLHESGHYDRPGEGNHDGAGEAHSEDNYGDPYGKHDNPRQASKTALADGVDPLQFVLMASPKGEGEAEKEAHHDEATTVRTAAVLVGLYSDLVNDLNAE